MQKTIREIAEVIGATIEGDTELKIQAIRGIREAVFGDLTFVSDKKYLPELEKSGASAAIVPMNTSNHGKTLLKVENPTFALAKALHFLNPHPIPHPRGIHSTAIIGEGVYLGKDVAIGPYTVIGDSCSIGDRSVLYGGVHVGSETQIGADTIIYPRVTIRERIRIGNRVIINPGAVIGAEGFGFTQTEKGYEKVPQVGIVILEDDVEIGANSCIDRAALEATIIGRGTKIDNLVQVGHNSVLGESCILSGQVGISGSVRIGNGVMLGGQVGIGDHLSIADDVRIAAQSGVIRSILEAGDYMGTLAKPAARYKEIQAYLNQLPELVKTLEALTKEETL